MSKKVNFTKAIIEAAEVTSKGRRLVLRDSKVSGLQCRVTPTGVKTFSVFRRVKGGRPERITLGRFPDMTVAMARIEAAKINAAIAVGQSTAEVRRSVREEMTFGELFDEYSRRHGRVKKRRWKTEETRYRLYLEKPFGKKRLSEIERTDIVKVFKGITRQIKKTKKPDPKNPKYKSGTTANRVLALASILFSWAIEQGECSENPAKGIKKYRERSRERFLQPDELPRFFESLAAETNTVIRDYILMSLLTGARRENVLSMRWDQISLERKEWRIPRTKNGDPQTIPLTKEAMKVLKQCRNNDSDYVFPGSSKTGHLTEPRKGWDRILKRAKIEDLRIHDLRRTLGSWQARTGASLIIVGKSLGHRSPQATAIYSRLDLDPVRKSVETATAAILKAANVKRKKKRPKVSAKKLKEKLPLSEDSGS